MVTRAAVGDTRDLPVKQSGDAALPDKAKLNPRKGKRPFDSAYWLYGVCQKMVMTQKAGLHFVLLVIANLKSRR